MNGRLYASAMWVLAMAASAWGQTPAGSAFTYQGLIHQDGDPLNDTADFRFTLWDAEADGNQIGNLQASQNVAVVDGLVTTSIDFGVGAFNGDARWLQVEVRSPAGSGNFTTLDPRQPLTVTPYALQTRGIFVANNGRVGIGTNEPTARLHVVDGEILISDANSAPTITLVDETDGDTFVMKHNRGLDRFEILNGDGDQLMVVKKDGQVGFGTVPSNPFDMTRAVEVRGSEDPDLPHAGSTGVTLRNPITGDRWGLLCDSAGEFSFLHDGNADPVVNVPVLRIRGGSDIAEPFNVNGHAAAEPEGPAIEPGMVVSIDPVRTGELRVSHAAYDMTVAGVISGANGIKTGMTLTQEGSVADGEYPVALTGRVWCFCDADANGAIQPGDLLTTSNTAGHAMKVTDHGRAGGATIGKAMSSLASGKGLVLVLVNLQ